LLNIDGRNWRSIDLAHALKIRRIGFTLGFGNLRRKNRIFSETKEGILPKKAGSDEEAVKPPLNMYRHQLL
jgi:hypothetical protein